MAGGRLTPAGPDRPTHRIAIVGAGYAGASAALQLVRASPQPLAITLIDPAAVPGAGLAYSTPDPDHRLNAPSFVHTLLPDDITHFSRWCQAQRLLEGDPEALAADGCVYARRRDFGRYITDALAGLADPGEAGRISPLTHHRAKALRLERLAPARPDRTGGQWWVHSDQGRLAADAVVLATGHLPAGLPGPLQPLGSGPQAHPALLTDPWSAQTAERLRHLPAQARVLVLGAGLTALDALTTLVRHGRARRIDVLSRRGLQPAPQAPWPPLLMQLLATQPGLGAALALPPDLMRSRLAAEPPAWLTQAPATARGWLQALRQACAQAEQVGEGWTSAFDALRDTLGQTWPRLPPAERRRALHRLRPWYDTWRYRSPPTNQATVASAEAAGTVVRHRGHLLSAAAQADGRRLTVHWRMAGGQASDGGDYDAVLNCTGTAAAAAAADPLLAAAMADGLVCPDGSGLGLAVDRSASALDADRRPVAGLYAIGPPTLGACGDAVGAIFIAAQAARMVPVLLAGLSTSGASRAR